MKFRMDEAKSWLSEAVEIETHTPEGSGQFIRWTIDFVRKHSLGDVREVIFPDEAALGGQRSNIVIDRGPAGASERLLLEGHFDTVSPHPGYEQPELKAVRGPYQLYTDPQHPHLWRGLGTYDMKGGIIGILMAMKYAKLPPHRAMRALLVDCEEHHSQGMHAAKMSGLLDDVTCAVTTEIPVGGTLEDSPLLLHGRPGRIEFEIQVNGKPLHRGRAREEERHEYAYHRLNTAVDASWSLPVPEDPFYANIWKGRAAPGNGSYGALPNTMSIADRGEGRVDVYSLDRHLNPERVRDALIEHTARALRDRMFYILLAPDRDPRLKPTPGWYENPAGRFVRTSVGMGSEAILRQGTYGSGFQLGIGGPTADEPLIGVPTLTVAPIGQGEHTEQEVIDGRSITGIQVPFMVGMAEYDGDLQKAADA